MKKRLGFVSNSSATSFIIENKSDEQKTLVDFVKENPQFIEEFKEDYDWYKDDPDYIQEKLIESAELNNELFDPKESKECVFGDEDGSLIGHVFDYILRDGGDSKNFRWKLNKFLR